MILDRIQCLCAATVLSLCSQPITAEETSLIEGYSQPYRIANVAAQVSGIVDQLTHQAGDSVHEGDCVLRLDSRVHQKRLQISEATRNAVGELNSAQAELESSRKRVLIVRDLSSRQHASDEELFRAENELLVAEANLKTVQEKLRLRQAEYEKLQAESQHYQVTAPFDGVIVSYTKQRGEFVGSVAPEVCVIAELDRLSVDFLLPRQNRPSFSLDQQVRVRFVPSDTIVSGTIYFISPYPDGETNTYEMRVLVDNAQRHLNAGERCVLAD